MLDIVIISVPGSLTRSPLAAPALLKSSVEAAGFTCKTIDFNIQFYQDVSDPSSLDTYFTTGLNTEEYNRANELVETWTKDIVKLNPKFVGISVFTYQNRIATKLFCEHIRRGSDIKIILGGQGLSDGGIQGVSGFGKELYDNNLIDHWIRSEGEISLIELLKGNVTYPGINSDTFKQIDDLDGLPFPNYDDYKLETYKLRSLPITGSRGCVRACSFCDIHEHWKYRYRSGQNIADEILYLNKKYQVSNFTFSDSLVNGNLKEFNKFTEILAKHNKTTDQKISWSSQYIVRSDGQINEEYWQNIADSGGTRLAIGVETGSDRVRLHMNKKFTNCDLDYTMSMLSKFNVTCQFLMIVGYPTETEQDFQETLDMFTRYQSYISNIISINIGSTLGILPGTPLFNSAEQLNLITDKYENNWISLDNPELTLTKRIQRRHYLKEHVLKLGYHVQEDSDHMMQILDHNKEMFDNRLAVKKKIRIKNAK